MALVHGDLHIHVGRTNEGRSVKITASPQLNLENIPRACKQKGIQLVGLVDAACSGVLKDLLELKQKGLLQPIVGGGYNWEGCTLFLGHEVEIAHTTGKEAHFLAFFPDLENLHDYATALEPWITNPSLSTQRLKVSADTWLQTVVSMGGVALAAHAFTPHKGVYGNCVRKLGEMFRDPHLLQGLELGLSANTNMALRIKDTHDYTYISNSDAHSLANIGREFTIYNVSAVNFKEWSKALKHGGQGVIATHGMDPLLGKYYRSYCNNCKVLAKEAVPTFACPNCGRPMVYGVWDRICEIMDWNHSLERPPYRSHVPLRMLPGVGPASYGRLIDNLGTEIDIMYNVSLDTISNVAGPHIALQIMALRQGTLTILPGGGGKYGRVTNVKER